MGRSPCCDKVGLKKGPWTPEEDQKLLAYIEEHGHGSWRALPPKAGLQRCGKSCRLRWSNYLRPDIKRGKFTVQEEQAIIQLHALLGNRWSAIATHLPKRTDNEIKNYWNTHLKKRLAKMGIDPVTHKPKNDSLLSSSLTADGQSKNAANLSHMAQWESARLEAEARLVRQSKLRSPSFQTTPHDQLVSALAKPAAGPHTTSRCLDILTALNDVAGGVAGLPVTAFNIDLESPTSTLSYSENASQVPTTLIEFAGNNNSSSGFCEDGILKESEEDWKFESSTDLSLYKEGIDSSLPFTSAIHDNMTIALENEWTVEPEQLLRTGNHDQDHIAGGNFVEKFTDLLLSKARDKSLSEAAGDSDHHNNEGGESSSVNDGSSRSGCGNDYYEDNKNYWYSILNLVNASSPSDSMF